MPEKYKQKFSSPTLPDSSFQPFSLERKNSIRMKQAHKNEQKTFACSHEIQGEGENREAT